MGFRHDAQDYSPRETGMSFYIFGEGKTEKILVSRLTDDKAADKLNLNLSSKPLFIGTI